MIGAEVRPSLPTPDRGREREREEMGEARGLGLRLFANDPVPSEARLSYVCDEGPFWAYLLF